MRSILVILFFSIISLYAKEQESCNTVQLLSVPVSKMDRVLQKEYPQDCQVMQIGNNVAVRCGCFSKLDGAQQRLQQLQQKYASASLASTYRYRFSKKAPVHKKSAKKSLGDEKRSCYSVALTSVPKTQKNLDTLFRTSYPKDCKVMEFRRSYGVRCGCFETLDEAKTRQEELSKDFIQSQIMQTYRYRFKPDYKVARVYQNPDEQLSADEQEMRLMLQVFLYKGDLESAYKIAKLGFKQHPNSYYWNQKMADICQWTNRTPEAMKHLQKIYELHYDPAVEDKLINYGMLYYQYEAVEPLVLNKAQREPTEKNIDTLINVYKKTGMPEKALDVLDSEYKRTTNPLLLTKALELALEIGDIERAHNYVAIIENNPPYSKIDAVLVAKYYYVKRKIDKAYEVLLTAQNKELIEDVNNTKELKYFELTSDIAWYLQKNVVAAKASKKLMDVHRARLVDYERISLVYPDIDDDVAMEAVKRGYEKYHLSYMFFSYANSAVAKKKFTELEKLLQSVDESTSTLVKDPMYWIIKSKVYNYNKKFEQEELALKKALALAPNNNQIKISLLWHFMEISDVKNIKLLLMEIEDDAPVSESLYFPLASAYFYLHNIDRAAYYLDEMRLRENRSIESIEYKFLLAYVKQMQNNEESFQTLMREITETLKKQMKDNPSLKKDNNILSNYLRAAMYVLNPDKFEKKLKKAKPYLKKQNYDEIAYSWSVYIKAYEKSHKVYEQTHTKELWMQFSDALIFQHHTRIENLLDHYLQLLAPGDTVSALLGDGQTAFAQSKNFEQLSNNSASENGYIQYLDLTKRRTDMLDLKLARLLREPLLQNYLNLSNRTYLGDSWYIGEGIQAYRNSSTDTTTLINVPATTYKVSLSAKKEFQRGYTQMQITYNHSMQNYLSVYLDGEYRASTDFTFGAKVGKNIEAQETTQLYLGGKKDSIEARVRYQILNSTVINVRYQQAKFYAQDDLYLGDGDYLVTNVSYQIRNGYPDMLVGVFYDTASYDETSGSRGIIDELQTQNFQVLPNKFYNVGMNFSYGMVNRSIYTRVWRPYFEFAPYYNSDIDDYTYSVHIGYGGKVWHQDHLSIGASYSNYLNGVGGQIFEIYINYQFLYTLSKEF